MINILSENLSVAVNLDRISVSWHGNSPNECVPIFYIEKLALSIEKAPKKELFLRY
jgi:hypothetical protein